MQALSLPPCLEGLCSRAKYVLICGQTCLFSGSTNHLSQVHTKFLLIQPSGLNKTATGRSPQQHKRCWCGNVSPYSRKYPHCCKSAMKDYAVVSAWAQPGHVPKMFCSAPPPELSHGMSPAVLLYSCQNTLISTCSHWQQVLIRCWVSSMSLLMTGFCQTDCCTHWLKKSTSSL